MKLKYCFVDMDGVVVDFVEGICKVHNRLNPYLNSKAHGIFEIDKIWGISEEEFWSKADYKGFWENLNKTPLADALIKFVCDKFGDENVCILTSPVKNSYCIPEKTKWIEKYYPHLKKNILFGSAKKFLAGPDRILIDDRDSNITSFSNYGGKVITCPQLWNTGRFIPQQFEYITKALDNFNE